VPDNSLGTNTQVGVLQEKVDSLQRQISWFYVLVALLLATLIGLHVYRRAVEGRGGGTIEGRNFVVRDAHGNARAVLQSMDPVGVQLVFFRDPLPGDTWRDRAGQGPFSFAVRDWRGNAQMTMSKRDEGRLDFQPGSIAMSRGEKPTLVLYLTANGEGRINLIDSTGALTSLPAASQRIVGSRTRRR